MQNEIEKLSMFLASWRSTHKAPTPLPKEVWLRAANIATRVGVSATARALRLDAAVLKRKVAEIEVAPSLDFIEIVPALPKAPAPTVLDCVLEVQSHSGARLRVEARNMPAAELVAMIRQFGG